MRVSCVWGRVDVGARVSEGYVTAAPAVAVALDYYNYMSKVPRDLYIEERNKAFLALQSTP